MTYNTTTKSLQFKVITDHLTARQLWEDFSPHLEIDDEWDFRWIFYRYLPARLHFMVAYADDQPVALLPLQCNAGEGPVPSGWGKEPFYEFFGGDDTDSNSIWFKPGYAFAAEQLLLKLPTPSFLAPLRAPCEVRNQSSSPYTPKYIASIEGLGSFDDYVGTVLSGTSRSRLKNHVRRAERSGLQVVLGSTMDLRMLYSLNILRFGDASSFNWQYRRKLFADLAKHYHADIFRVVSGDRTVAVSFALVFGATYLSLNIGYDYTVVNLGKFVVKTQFERAISLGCTLFDAGKGDSGWKEQLRLTCVPQYQLTVG